MKDKNMCCAQDGGDALHKRHLSSEMSGGKLNMFQSNAALEKLSIPERSTQRLCSRAVSNPISFAICTSAFIKLCKNVYSGM
jgi:hypothetical protein